MLLRSAIVPYEGAIKPRDVKTAP